MWTELAHYLFVLLGFSLFFQKLPVLKSLPYVMVIIHFGLTLSFIVDDYSTLLVWKHSHEAQIPGFKVAALWSNYEGALLLLLTFLTYYTWILKKGYNPKLFLKIIGSYFLILEFLANPFLKQWIERKEGLDTNPLLQDSLLLIHPPILYFGYAGLLFPFLTGSYYYTSNQFFYDSFRKSSYLSWTFLTLGVGLGSWWAFHELGWGGYWFWDPVETLAIIPWILTLISFHSLKTVKSAINFGILSFLSALLGNYLLRSGLLNSLHSFAFNSERTNYLLIPLLIVLGYGFKLIIQSFPNGTISLKYLKWNTFLFWKRVLSFNILGILLIGSCYSLQKDQIFSPLTYLEFLIPLTSCFLGVMLLVEIIPKNFLTLPYEKFGYFIGFCFSYGISNFLESSKLFIILSTLFLTMLLRNFSNETNKRMKFSHFGFGLLILMISLNNQFKEEILFFLQSETDLFISPYKFYFLQMEEREDLLKTSYQFTYNILNETFKNLGKSQIQIDFYQLEDLLSKKADIVTNGITDLKVYRGDETMQISKEPALTGLWISILLLTISGTLS